MSAGGGGGGGGGVLVGSEAATTAAAVGLGGGVALAGVYRVAYASYQPSYRWGRHCGSEPFAHLLPFISRDSSQPPQLDLCSEHFFCNNYPEFVTRVTAARARAGALLGRSLHSSTSQLNMSRV